MSGVICQSDTAHKTQNLVQAMTFGLTWDVSFSCRVIRTEVLKKDKNWANSVKRQIKPTTSLECCALSVLMHQRVRQLDIFSEAFLHWHIHSTLAAGMKFETSNSKCTNVHWQITTQRKWSSFNFPGPSARRGPPLSSLVQKECKLNDVNSKDRIRPNIYKERLISPLDVSIESHRTWKGCQHPGITIHKLWSNDESAVGKQNSESWRRTLRWMLKLWSEPQPSEGKPPKWKGCEMFGQVCKGKA